MISNQDLKLSALAKNLKIKSADLVKLLKEGGLDGKTHSATLDREEFEMAMEILTSQNQVTNMSAYLAGKADVEESDRPKKAAPEAKAEKPAQKKEEKPAQKTEAKAEVKTEAKAETKAEAKTEPKPEIKTEAKADEKPAKTEQKAKKSEEKEPVKKEEIKNDRAQRPEIGRAHV